MMRRSTPVVVLGAGPAGLGAALRLLRRDSFEVTVVERQRTVGGNAGSFVLDGQRVDYGSHRLHPTCTPEILDDIRHLLGDDLLDRSRHGRIRLQGRWVHFPLRALDLLLNLPLAFGAGVMRDTLPRRGGLGEAETFAGVLERQLGPTICRAFYFPYARKIWGVAPEAIDAEQARRRVSAASIGEMLRKVARSVPIAGRGPGRRFFYPRLGFGQIGDAYHRAVVEAGGTVELEATAAAIELDPGHGATVSIDRPDGRRQRRAARVLSTMPLPLLVRSIRPVAPDAVLEAAAALRYRAMLLIYLVIETDRFTEYDAHYFPEADVAITRLSEPKNYSGHGPGGTTVLCAELPCAEGDEHWMMDDDRLGALVAAGLDRAGVPIDAAIRRVRTHRLTHAYPIYDLVYRAHLDTLDSWVRTLDRVVTVGRQGLFVHDNTHHTLAMAYAAADCVRPDGSLDTTRWAQHRRRFEAHVVED